MTSFDFEAISSALDSPRTITSGVDFTGKSLKLDTAKDAQPIVDAINACPNLQHLTLTGNTLGVAAAEAIAKALEHHPELKEAHFSDMFTGRMKTEIPPALKALGEGMIKAGARLSVLNLSDNAFGPIGVEGLAALLKSNVCSELEVLHLNNNGLGITGGRLLAAALGATRRLRVFVAGRNRLEDDGATALAKVFQSMDTLEEFGMPQNGIYHRGISALAQAFSNNPRLRRLDLNDNTVGSRGAAAVARALPRLKNLNCINFGDCLLKSKGVRTLAEAFRENNLPLEVVNLGHNEVGRVACMEVVDALTTPPRNRTLTKLVLAGNSFGGAANKQAMKDKLGASAELSDPDGDDSDAEETDSDAECESGSEPDDSTRGDDSQLALDDSNASLDTSDVVEMQSGAGRFLRDPTEANLRQLGDNPAALIDAHLQSIKEPEPFIQAYVEATLLVSGLPGGCSAAAALYASLSEAARSRHAVQWLLADSMLRGLALIKSENKEYKIRWSLPECYAALACVIEAPFFPPALRDTLKFFISRKLASMPERVRAAVELRPALFASHLS